MASHGVPLKTLKDCLQFLQWLENDSNMQGLVGHRLDKLLEKRYENVNASLIAKELSQFLNSASTFHKKLCTKPSGSYTGNKSAKNVTNALLDCIPRFLSAIYFLRYKVDVNFKALGGGDWAYKDVGVIAMYARFHKDVAERMIRTAGDIDKYLITKSGDEYGGIVPGGFEPGELKEGYRVSRSEGYNPGSAMLGDLQNILEKYSNQNRQNYFLDVFSTTVLSNSGADTSNVANALRLVQDFCKIFDEVNESDFENHLYTKDRCFDLPQLQKHCKNLIGPLNKLFNQDAFSFTGYAREYKKLKKQDIAKKMASWFKRNLETVMRHIKEIEGFTSKKNFKSVSVRKGTAPSTHIKAELEKYFTENFIRYGFTFYHHEYKTRDPPYNVLKTDWDGVIGMLKTPGSGLDELLQILNGEKCKQRMKDEEDEEAKEEPEDMELLNGEMVPVSKKEEPPPGKVPDDPKEVVPEMKSAPADGPPKSAATRAQGVDSPSEKVEGAQNQGKKAEGAQNQGKKAEGTPNQGSNHSVANTSSSPVLQAVQTQPPSDSRAGYEPPGDPVPSSGQVRDGQAVSSGSVPQGGQVAQSGARDDATTSSAAASASGGGGASRGGGGNNRINFPFDVDTAIQKFTKQNQQRLKEAESFLDNLEKRKENRVAERSKEDDYLQSELKMLERSLPVLGGVTIPNPVTVFDGLDGLVSQDDTQSLPDPILQQQEADDEWKFEQQKAYEVQEDYFQKLTEVINRSQHGGLFNGLKTTVIKDSASHPFYDGTLTRIDGNKLQHPSHTNEQEKQKVDDANHFWVKFHEQQKQRESDELDKIMNETDKIKKQVEAKYAADQIIGREFFEQDLLEDVHEELIDIPPQPTVDGYAISRETNVKTYIPPPVIDTEPADLLVERQNMWLFQGGTESGDDLDSKLEMDIENQALRKNASSLYGFAVPNPVNHYSLLDGTTLHDDSQSLPDAARQQQEADEEWKGRLQKIHQQQESDAKTLSERIKQTQYDTLLKQVEKNVPEGDVIKYSPPDLTKIGTPIGYPLKHKKTDYPQFYDNRSKESQKFRPAGPQGIVLSQSGQMKARLPPLRKKSHVSPISMQLDGMPPSILVDSIGYDLTRSPDQKVKHDVPITSHYTPPPPLTGKPTDNNAIVSDGSFVEPATLPPALPPPIDFVFKAATPRLEKVPDPDPLDLHIDIPKLTLPDKDLDFDLDFDDDSTHIKDNTLPNPIVPSTHAISFTLPPPDPIQSLPPPEDFDKKTIKQPDITLCLSSWATPTPTHGSSDIPETELFPAEAPRTVRDMLTWLAGLRNPKHHDTLKQCINKAFSGHHKDPSQLAIFINHAKIRPGDVFDILQLTAMFAGSVLTSIAPNWKANVSSRIVKPNSSTQSEVPDCCALLCQLRDYVYACHHQLQFLKAQCNRDKLSGGWKNDEYGSDITASNSPLQAFLTDGWDSTFETHLFDPCNLCHKSRIRMGFKKNDLPKTSQLGSVISTILSPSCGGEEHGALVNTVL
ncbi:Ribosome-binding protein 1 [Babesia bigemina]|uniref:Ribosome-binding protein 1 n=1 Tax=Babesia bigemina TaxID=5866 RepID=A0A061D7I6_BABBI|nr:Ribosome-binding protein 1 [Babesia bigemina]CDR93690.1 Ribosome-binding protein 1 [Babesia bigemina]|eukprot:XP_012765876.1 Ribosome-binding protein 1 [Babesia bigemina]